MNNEWVTQDNGDGSQSVVPAQMDMGEWAQMLPHTRHVHVWAVDEESDVPAPAPRCLARRICAGLWFIATGCGRGFAKP
jgi:hypothetical protein